MCTVFRLAIAGVLFALPAGADAQSNALPLTIALPDFAANSSADQVFARDITRTIIADLQRSGSIAPINSPHYVEKKADFDMPPSFDDWRGRVKALVIGRVSQEPDGKLRAEFRLWEIAQGQLLAGQQYFTAPEHWRAVAHMISDAIYERLTGKKGHFEADNRN